MLILSGAHAAGAEPVGACCFPAVCAEIEERLCAAAGGVYLGEGISCAGGCAIGACCFPGAPCALLHVPLCWARGGDFLGESAPCDACPPTCPSDLDGDGDVDEDDVRRALDRVSRVLAEWGPCRRAGAARPTSGIGGCCFPDGRCQIRPETVCDDLGGFYLGDGTTCAGGRCDTPRACCMPSGSCDEVLIAVCAAFGGIWHEDAPACADVACPLPCPDSDGDGIVGFADLLDRLVLVTQVVADEGPCP
jgi:hypothetical protein